MNGLFNQIAAKKLKDIDFDSYKECESIIKPRLSNLNLLPLIMEDILRVHPATPENSAFILGVVYYLFAPYKLYHQDVRMKNGIREIICKYMGWTDAPVVNYYAAMLVSYYKGQRWASKVNELGEELYKTVKSYDGGAD